MDVCFWVCFFAFTFWLSLIWSSGAVLKEEERRMPCFTGIMYSVSQVMSKLAPVNG
jgi:hypothetical protein